jgi:hypothetical protein
MSDNRTIVKQILRDYRRPKKYLPIVANSPGDCFQMDIMVYNRFQYDNYKYILTCVDVYSRYAQAIPLISKANMLPYVRKMFEDKMKMIPKHLNVDQELWNNRAIMMKIGRII